MNIKLITLLAMAAFAAVAAQGQELTKKIPAEAKFVVTINNKGIQQTNATDLIYTTLIKLEAFENLENDSDKTIKKFIETDLNLDNQAYVYLTNSDSVNYTGILLPLKSGHQVNQYMFPQFDTLPSYNGYERRVSEDGKTQVAWNQESMLILTGNHNYSFFQQDDIANRYGLDLGDQEGEWAAAAIPSDEAWAADEAQASEYNETDSVDATAMLETELAEIAEANEVEGVLALEEWEESAESEEREELAQETEDWEYAGEITDDSDIINEDDYDMDSDSTFLSYMAREEKNDSIKNNLTINWLARDFQNYLDPENNLARTKDIRITDQKTLVRLWLPNLDELYHEALTTYSLLKMSGIDFGQIKYGYKNATFDFIQDKHKLILKSNISLSHEMAGIFKAIYNNKSNKRFGNYIPENYLAYVSTNLSTEGYLQQITTLMNNWYAPLAGENAELLSIVATALEIALDEKSIAKLMQGDQVLFLNDLHKVSKEYTTYEYDEDYNYEEVLKTKEEYQPNFLWMFTSEDQRIFKKLLDFAVKRQKASLDNDIYTIADANDLGQLHFHFNKDIVFLGSDLEQITAIKENRFKSANNTKTKKDIRNYPVSIGINTAAIPEVINKLEIPVTETWSQTVQNLSEYGDLQMRSFKLKKNQISGEIAIELPSKEGNALQYLFKNVIENLGN